MKPSQNQSPQPSEPALRPEDEVEELLRTIYFEKLAGTETLEEVFADFTVGDLNERPKWKWKVTRNAAGRPTKLERVPVPLRRRK